MVEMVSHIETTRLRMWWQELVAGIHFYMSLTRKQGWPVILKTYPTVTLILQLGSTFQRFHRFIPTVSQLGTKHSNARVLGSISHSDHKHLLSVWVFHRFPLLGWCSHLSLFCWEFYHEKVLDFVKYFSCIY